MAESTEVWEKERVFVRGLTSSQYSISEYRKAMKAHPRVRRWEDVKWSGGPHLFHKMQVITPQTMPIQSVFMHLEELAPGAAGMNHGHQNEALLYILEGRGHDIHDGKRYDWKAGDVMIVHNGAVHQHFNDDPDHPARILIIKSKALFNFLNLVEQAKISDEIPGTTMDHQPSEEFGPASAEPAGARGS